jgi:hypothetical protein
MFKSEDACLSQVAAGERPRTAGMETETGTGRCDW